MIIPVEYYEVICDNCKKKWEDGQYGYTAFSDTFSLEHVLREEGWHMEEDKHYCDGCYSWGDNDELVLKNIEQPTP